MGRPKKFKSVDLETTQLYDEITKVQTDILGRLSLLNKSKMKRTHQCNHLVLDSQCPPFNPLNDYYDLFWKTYLLNEIKKQRLTNLKTQVEELNQSIPFMERKFDKYDRLVAYRKASSLEGSQKKFVCTIAGCMKNYDSQGALQLHKKLKHDPSKQERSQALNPSLFFEENGNNSAPFNPKK